jgi:hypothetical protein
MPERQARVYGVAAPVVVQGVQWVADNGGVVVWVNDAGLPVYWVNDSSPIFSPATGSLAAVGKAPTLLRNNPVFSPGVGSLSMNGLAPTAVPSSGGTRFITPPSGSAAVTGLAPTAKVSGWKVSWVSLRLP